jgi:spermidine synthase
MRWFFGFFLVSGFCSLVYQVVWLRLAMASFGVTAPMTSIVVSVFMAGLALGSWGVGIVAGRYGRTVVPALRLYGLAELVIAFSGTLVPAGLAAGRGVLDQGAAGAAWGSGAHYVWAAIAVAVVMLPFCTCMGATVPLGMWALRGLAPSQSDRSFSWLYVANVLGACLGTLISAFILIELLGFRGTAALTAALNALLAVAALALSVWVGRRSGQELALKPAVAVDRQEGRDRWPMLSVLFLTGFSSMGAEVIWLRQYTPFLGTVVYAFALILFVYLSSTFLGSTLCRIARGRWLAESVALLGLCFLLPLVAADPRIPLDFGLGQSMLRVVLGIAPLCISLGYLTPLLVDRSSGGDARRAGSAYAVNVFGCILGPLVAGFVLLPWSGERDALILLSLPLVGVGLSARWLGGDRERRALWGAALALAVVIAVSARSFGASYPGAIIRTDSAATVIVAGEGMRRQLVVNGVGMTRLTPITKMMVHLPLALLEQAPERGLVICLGMGTSFRSMAAWGIDTTAVELVPSVASSFGFFHSDAAQVLASGRARIVVDDGRRYLERQRQQYDVITVDPPPPPSAAGSSLLYSREFNALVRKRLRPGGYFQQWIPWGDRVTAGSLIRALMETFPSVRAFGSLEGWGIHLIAGDVPPRLADAETLARRLPPAAARDLTEWGPAASASEQLGLVLGREVTAEQLRAMVSGVPALTDDRPYNEYDVLRSALGKDH